MKVRLLATTATVALLLGGCAGSVSAPTAIQALSVEQRASLHVASVTADAAQGVEMSDGDFDVICEKVKVYMQSAPGAAAASGPTVTMKIHFTRFDRGSAFARAMLIGLGQIRIEATVDVVDANGATIGEYKVAKDFAIGGVVGATTSVEDVEDGFAKSVATIVTGQS